MSTFSLRDQLFNADTVGELADQFAGVHPEFRRDAFVKAVLSPFPDLQLKARIVHIAEMMRDHLPALFPAAVGVILEALPPPLDPTLGDDDFGAFIHAPLSQFVARYGCTAEHLTVSLAALREITKRFSAEDAIRSFINAFPDATLDFLLDCATDANYHVRRLASEGSRPRLPWSGRLLVDVRWPLGILDRLYTDPTRYVTRSVANHLNDISKIDPDLVIERLRVWRASGHQAPAEMAFIERHALRTLVKTGHREALSVLGFGRAPDLRAIAIECTTPSVRIGEPLRFTVGGVANSPQALVIDYRMHFARPDGRASSKVFKLKTVQLVEGERWAIEKRHPLRQMTTRTLHPGTHRVEVQANGVGMGEFCFDLVHDRPDCG